DVDFTSGSGDLSVGLRRGQPARLDVVTAGGQLRSDLPIENNPPSNTARAITVKARTGSGDVRIFPAQPAVPARQVAQPRRQDHERVHADSRKADQEPAWDRGAARSPRSPTTTPSRSSHFATSISSSASSAATWATSTSGSANAPGTRSTP